MPEQDALSGAKFGGGLFLKDFPARIKVLTRDPMVYSKFANTYYAFAVYNLDTDTVQILAKGPGFAKRFQQLNDPKFGGDVRKLELSIETNGKSGMNIRYIIDSLGVAEFTPQQQRNIQDQAFDLAEKIQKDNPGALRLSEVNAGKKIPETTEDGDILLPEQTQDMTVDELGGDPINLDDIPF